MCNLGENKVDFDDSEVISSEEVTTERSEAVESGDMTEFQKSELLVAVEKYGVFKWKNGVRWVTESVADAAPRIITTCYVDGMAAFVSDSNPYIGYLLGLLGRRDSELGDMRSELKLQGGLLCAADSRMGEISADNERLREEAGRLFAENAHRASDYSDANKENLRLLEDNARLLVGGEMASDTSEGLMADLRKSHKEISALRKKLASSDEELARIKLAIDKIDDIEVGHSYMGKVHILATRYLRLKGALDQISCVVGAGAGDDYEGTASRVLKAINESAIRIHELDELLSAARDELKGSQGECRELGEEVKNLAGRCGTLLVEIAGAVSADLYRMREEAYAKDVKIAELEKVIRDEVHSNWREVVDDNDKLRAINAALEDKRDEYLLLKKMVESEQRFMREACADALRWEEECNGLRGEVAELTKRVGELEAALRKATCEKNFIDSHVAFLEEVIAGYQARLGDGGDDSGEKVVTTERSGAVIHCAMSVAGLDEGVYEFDIPVDVKTAPESGGSPFPDDLIINGCERGTDYVLSGGPTVVSGEPLKASDVVRPVWSDELGRHVLLDGDGKVVGRVVSGNARARLF